MRLYSWNVNGLRSALKKGFLDWLRQSEGDVICLQETRLADDTPPEELAEVPEYRPVFTQGERPGYSGVAILSRVAPREVRVGFGHPRYDAEGRTLVAEFDDFTLVNGYFPNGGQGPERLAFKLDYYQDLLNFLDGLTRQGRPFVVTGDLNTAHQERDIARPKENRNTSGFMDIERAWIDRYLDAGMLDSFRLFEEGGEHYTWWSQRGGARARNVGWRLDYFLVSATLRDRVRAAAIHPEVSGSDHCPVRLDLA